MYILRDYTEKELPPADEAVKNSLEFISKVTSEWSKGKNYDDVQTYTHWDEDKQFWAARVSRHADLTYQQLLDTVFHNHTENEAQYIPMVEHFRVLDSSRDERWVSRRVNYKFPFPLSNRDMDIWMTQKETIESQQFVNVTVPRKIDSNLVKGRYVSVEVVTQLPDGQVEWAMCTTSDAGGWLPQFVQRPEMTKAVAQDIPEFRKWISKK